MGQFDNNILHYAFFAPYGIVPLARTPVVGGPLMPTKPDMSATFRSGRNCLIPLNFHKQQTKTTMNSMLSLNIVRRVESNTGFLFGNSGSGLVRRFTGQEIEAYAFTGPLSKSKLCDNILIHDNKITYGSDNPGIFTDAYCYLAWIAALYGMKLADGYTRSPSCTQAKGDRANINQSNCMGRDTKSLDQTVLLVEQLLALFTGRLCLQQR